MKEQMLSWASRFDICSFLDSHAYPSDSGTFECLLAAGALDAITADTGNALTRLDLFLKQYNEEDKDWLFGHFGYGLGREIEQTVANEGSADPDGFSDLFFFVPEILIILNKDTIRIGVRARSGDEKTAPSPGQVLREILASPPAFSPTTSPAPYEDQQVKLLARFNKEEYLQTVRRLQEHILRGDCYEINFCQEFYAENVSLGPLSIWRSLSQASPNPFAAYYRVGEKFLLCASPERYLKKKGNTLISQPIKGTSPRIHADPAGDLLARDRLFHSDKDRSENVMVVDLVRNDLSKICLEGTVTVEELFGIYSFPQVHQMISTVRGQLPEGTGLTDCIRASFPMGSMTGAPKKRVMELINRYERSPRGLYSGTLGYVSPEGDFDFNVVIRSILYNRETGYLSYQVGSGITWYSDPATEYEECRWKAEAMIRALDERG